MQGLGTKKNYTVSCSSSEGLGALACWDKIKRHEGLPVPKPKAKGYVLTIWVALKPNYFWVAGSQFFLAPCAQRAGTAEPWSLLGPSNHYTTAPQAKSGTADADNSSWKNSTFFSQTAVNHSGLIQTSRVTTSTWTSSSSPGWCPWVITRPLTNGSTSAVAASLRGILAIVKPRSRKFLKHSTIEHGSN